MTFAELIFLLAAVVGLYFLMKPLQRRLELYFYKFFRSKVRHKEGATIDVTNYKKEQDTIKK